jgi:hypothetical protein
MKLDRPVLDNRLTDGGEVVSTGSVPLPNNIFRYSLLLEAESFPGL